MEPYFNYQINSVMKDIDSFLNQKHYSKGKVNPLKIAYYGTDAYGAHLKSPHHFAKRHEYYTKDVNSLVEKIRDLAQFTIDHTNEIENQTLNDLSSKLKKLNSEVYDLQQDLDKNFSNDSKYGILKREYERASAKLNNLGVILLEIQNSTENLAEIEKHLNDRVPPTSEPEIGEREGAALTFSKDVTKAQMQMFYYLQDFPDSLSNLLNNVGSQESPEKILNYYKYLIRDFNVRTQNFREIIQFIINNKDSIDDRAFMGLSKELANKLVNFYDKICNLSIPRKETLREDRKEIIKTIEQYCDLVDKINMAPSTDPKILNRTLNAISRKKEDLKEVKKPLEDLVPSLSKKEFKDEQAILTLSENIETAQKQISSYLKEFSTSLSLQPQYLMGMDPSEGYLGFSGGQIPMISEDLIDNFGLRIRNIAEIIQFLINNREAMDSETFTDLTKNLTEKLEDLSRKVQDLVSEAQGLSGDYKKLYAKIGQFIAVLQSIEDTSIDSETLNALFKMINR